MFRLFTVLKARVDSGGMPVTEDEIEIAAGRKVLDPSTASEYLAKLEQASQTIVDAFRKQVETAAVRLDPSIPPITHLNLGSLESRALRRSPR